MVSFRLKMTVKAWFANDYYVFLLPGIHKTSIGRPLHHANVWFVTYPGLGILTVGFSGALSFIPLPCSIHPKEFLILTLKTKILLTFQIKV
jgi:hypothetical protein